MHPFEENMINAIKDGSIHEAVVGIELTDKEIELIHTPINITPEPNQR